MCLDLSLLFGSRDEEEEEEEDEDEDEREDVTSSLEILFFSFFSLDFYYLKGEGLEVLDLGSYEIPTSGELPGNDCSKGTDFSPVTGSCCSWETSTAV